MKRIFFLLLTAILCTGLYAQKEEDKIKTKNLPGFHKIINTSIPGAPILGQPMQITGTQQEIRTEKHGLVYPALYDWNHDGKTDLLLGEFETGETGSYIKVYLNEGTNQKPKYSGKYFYAQDVKGDTITAHQWCCIGIHPRMVDLDKDGYVDILSGQYNPGKVSWWRGTKDGFLPRQFVPQEGYVEGARYGFGDQLDPKSNDYWNYTSAGFGDFNGDGLMDLFVGGFDELRVALNEGTKDTPKFGLRKYLLGIDGQPLSVVKPTQAELDKASRSYKKPHFAGVYKSFITPVDWDQDGVLDLLVTHLYGNKKTKDPIVFFRGVQTDKGLRFEDAKPLFTADNVLKTFPGCQPNIAVVDYNHDGIMDLVFGISIPTVNGFEADTLVANNFLNDFGLEAPGKDAGRAIEWEGSLENIKKKLEKQPELKSFYLGKFTDYKYLTLRHRGYVYVMLGKQNPIKAEVLKGVRAKDEFKLPVNQTVKNGGNGPVTYNVKVPGAIQPYSEASIEVTIDIKEGYHAYSNTKANIAMGLSTTTVEYELPKGFELIGDPVVPAPKPRGAYQVYEGNGLKFIQKFRVTGFNEEKSMPAGEYKIGVTVNYQVCDEGSCLPPETAKIEMKVNYGI